jgi:hypothetical protein
MSKFVHETSFHIAFATFILSLTLPSTAGFKTYVANLDGLQIIPTAAAVGLAPSTATGTMTVVLDTGTNGNGCTSLGTDRLVGQGLCTCPGGWGRWKREVEQDFNLPE